MNSEYKSLRIDGNARFDGEAIFDGADCDYIRKASVYESARKFDGNFIFDGNARFDGEAIFDCGRIRKLDGEAIFDAGKIKCQI